MESVIISNFNAASHVAAQHKKGWKSVSGSFLVLQRAEQPSRITLRVTLPGNKPRPYINCPS
jgi:hypothetical protein